MNYIQRGMILMGSAFIGFGGLLATSNTSTYPLTNTQSKTIEAACSVVENCTYSREKKLDFIINTIEQTKDIQRNTKMWYVPQLKDNREALDTLYEDAKATKTDIQQASEQNKERLFNEFFKDFEQYKPTFQFYSGAGLAMFGAFFQLLVLYSEKRGNENE